MENIVIRRIFAYLIDWVLNFIICIPFFFIGPQFDMDYLLYPSIKMFSAYGVLLGVLLLILLPLLKDLLFKNASLGKKILKLQILDEKGEDLHKKQNLILRNVTFYFPMIDFLIMILNKGNSLDDLISKTTVMKN